MFEHIIEVIGDVALLAIAVGAMVQTWLVYLLYCKLKGVDLRALGFDLYAILKQQRRNEDKRMLGLDRRTQ